MLKKNQRAGKKAVLKIIKEKVKNLPEMEYDYNVYQIIDGLRIKVGTEKNKVNHYRAAKRLYLRSLRVVPFIKDKTSNRQQRLAQKRKEQEELEKRLQESFDRDKAMLTSTDGSGNYNTEYIKNNLKQENE